MIAWREPAAEFRDRDLGLAEVLIAFSKNLQAIGEDGFQRLEALPAAQQGSDPTVLSDLEGLYLQQQKVAEAVEWAAGWWNYARKALKRP